LCGGGNIGRADYISMIEMTTLAARKDSTNKAIAFSYAVWECKLLYSAGYISPARGGENSSPSKPSNISAMDGESFS